jgi:hypothetical protein
MELEIIAGLVWGLRLFLWINKSLPKQCVICNFLLKSTEWSFCWAHCVVWTELACCQHGTNQY